MAQLTFSLGPLSRSFTLSDGDATRIQNWATDNFGPGTTQQIWNQVALGLANQLLRAVKQHERAIAQPNIPDIGVT